MNLEALRDHKDYKTLKYVIELRVLVLDMADYFLDLCHDHLTS